MNKSVNALTPLPANLGSRQIRVEWFLWPFILTALLAYIAPWVVNPSTSLSLNACDLAEWASLHPAARVSNPLLLTSLLLRLPPVCLALIAGFHGARAPKHWLWWARVSFVFFIAAALLPPLEFFTQTRGDSNYQQQFTLTMITLIGGLAGLSDIAGKFRRHIIFVVVLIGGAVCVIGLARGYDLMLQFDLPVQIGFGGIAIAVVFFGAAMSQIRRAFVRTA